MVTRSDVRELLSAAPGIAVSIYLPTHLGGRDARQDPIRLRNLLGLASDLLREHGVADPESILGETRSLVDDGALWRGADAGLALFVDRGGVRRHPLSMPAAEQVVVGEHFAVRPLLPLLAADGAFAVLTVTERAAALRRASRFRIEAESAIELPEHPMHAGEDFDYQNPVYASPANRPNVGTASIPNAQVYGDSPPEFRKTRLLAYIAALAKASEAWLAAQPMPLVIVADPETSGHLRAAAGLRSHLAGVVEANPAGLDDGAMLTAAYARVAESFSREAEEALDAANGALGRGEATAITSLPEIVKAAADARIATLLLPPQSTPLVGADDIVEAAIRGTVLGGGAVHVVEAARLPGHAEAVALLRY